jgi:hypothetical protein
MSQSLFKHAAAPITPRVALVSEAEEVRKVAWKEFNELSTDTKHTERRAALTMVARAIELEARLRGLLPAARRARRPRDTGAIAFDREFNRLAERIRAIPPPDED